MEEGEAREGENLATACDQRKRSSNPDQLARKRNARKQGEAQGGPKGKGNIGGEKEKRMGKFFGGIKAWGGRRRTGGGFCGGGVGGVSTRLWCASIESFN